MKLQLEITHSLGKTVPFEHAGPRIQIGRDPACELAFQNGESQGVSWKHALIELTPDGVFVRDLESSNGTFVNDKRIDKRIRLETGDHVRLGSAGPYLKLLLVDLSGAFKKEKANPVTAAPPAPALPGRSQKAENDNAAAQPQRTLATRVYLKLMESRYRKIWIGSGIGAACFVVFFGLSVVIQGGLIGWLFGETNKLGQQVVVLDEKVARATDTAQRATQIAENMGKKIPVEGPEVFKRALQSVALVETSDGTGTGTLIDRQRKYVLTAYHVVETHKEVQLVFPSYDATGQLLTDYLLYDSTTRIKGKVLSAKPECDLALIQVERLPPLMKEMPIATQSPIPGERIHIVGNPGAIRPSLWGYNQGSVRQVFKAQYNFADDKNVITQRIHAWTVKVQNPTNTGDSGGPHINDRGELVGVHSAGNRATAVATAIDVREIHSLLKMINP